MREIKLPSIENIRLAELVGCLLGDGYIGAQYEVSVTENSLLDVFHLSYIFNLIEELFNIRSFIFISKKRNAIRCKIYSKVIQKFLINNLQLIKGRKIKNKHLKIPDIYFENKEHLKACLRGIFDTDGCFCRHRISDPLIEIDSYNPILRNSIIKALKLLNFSVSNSGRKIYIYSKNDIKNFFNIIGTNNLRNKIKYEFWLKNNIVPKTNEVKTFNFNIIEKLRNSRSEDWVKFNIEDLYDFNLKIDTCADSLMVRT